MKQKLVVYLAGLLTVVGLGFGQAQFSDVPAGHWAKEAVDRITSCGLIIGFPDGTFRGNQNLTRYQAALIFQRLLTELEKGGQCVNGGSLSSDDLTTIRNGVQELAAELAALGVRVSALEDNSASKDDIAQLQAAIDELKGMQGGQSGMSDDALKDLADRVEAASVAADTALAQSQILGERLDTVEGDVAALKTQVDADADSIRALNELAVLLNQDVLSLQDRVTALESAVGNVDVNQFATKEDVNAVQEFATALRGDLVNLTDKVNGIDDRVKKLEAVTFTVSGSIKANYTTKITTGINFDIDRLFKGNVFGGGTDHDGDAGGAGVDPWFGRRFKATNPTQLADLNANDLDGGITLSFGIKNNTFKADGSGISDVTINTEATNSRLGSDNFIKVNDATLNGALAGQPFKVTYSASGSSFKFNSYLFANDNSSSVDKRGVVATLTAKSWPLSPTFTVVTGNGKDNQAGATEGFNSGAVIPATITGDYFGTRAELGLGLLDTKIALSYAEVRGVRAGFGVDYSLGIGPVKVDGAYVASKPFTSAATSFNDPTVDNAFYTRASVALGIVNLSGGYFAIDPTFEAGVAGMSANDSRYSLGMGGLNSDAPYGPNTVGFNVDGSLSLGIFGVKGYFLSFSDFDTRANPQSAFGVNASVNLFAGFSITGRFNNANVNGAQASQLAGNNTPDKEYYTYAYNANNQQYSSGFGGALSHDGKADNALIKGLNLTVAYDVYYNDKPAALSNSYSDLQAYGDYNLKLAFLTIKPNLRFHSFNDSAGTVANYTTFKYGVQVSTDPLGIILKPGLDAAVAGRNTNFSALGAAAAATSSEFYWRVGINLNEFFASGSVFKVAYASYTGSGLSGSAGGFATAGNDNLFSNTRDRLYKSPGSGGAPWTYAPGTSAGGVGGLYLEWKYGNLTTAAFLGSLTDAAGNGVSQGSAFKVSYEVKF